MIVVELDSLEVFGRHGVLDEERRDGQTFIYDVRLEVGDGALSDKIEDAVDYREVAELRPRGLRRASVQPDRGPRRGRCRCAHRSLRGRAGACASPQASPRWGAGRLLGGYRRAGFFFLTSEIETRYPSPAALRTTVPLPVPTDAST